MKRNLQKVSYFLFLGLGVFLFYVAFKKHDFFQIWETLQSADITWAGMVLAISVLNHFSRVKRWQLLLVPLGRPPKFWNAFIALMSGYLMSYAVPRLGEITRTGALVKTDSLPFQGTFGTVITERITDIACLFLVLLMAIFIEYDFLVKFYLAEIHLPLNVFLIDKLSSFKLIGMLGALIGILILAISISQWKRWRERVWMRKIILFVSKIWEGISSIARMPHKWQFLGHTAFIWLTYFLMTYLWFFSFEETSGLNWKAGLAMMVVGSFGRSLPIQGGGMGAYHYLFTQAILLYGVAGEYGLALAVMIHGLQTVYYILVGGMCWLVLSLKKPSAFVN